MLVVMCRVRGAPKTHIKCFRARLLLTQVLELFRLFAGLNDMPQRDLYGFAEKDMIFLIRLLGWFLVIAAVLVASLEMVMALCTGTYVGLATRDMWTLLSGVPPSFETSLAQWQETTNVPSKLGILLSQAGVVMMEMPAWTMVGLVGGLLVLTSRVHRLHQPNHYRRLFR